MEKIDEVYGFRFSQTLNQSFHELFALGHQRVMQAEEYKWDGMKHGKTRVKQIKRRSVQQFPAIF